MKKIRIGLVAGVLACAFAFTTPMLVGCGDDQKIKDLETQITTLKDENTALKADKIQLINEKNELADENDELADDNSGLLAANATLTDENAALKADKEASSFKSDVVAVLSLAGLMGYGCANDSREARDYFFEGTNTFDNAVELEAWSLVVKNYLPQVKPNQLYKIVATRDNNSMSYYFKVNYANGEYDFALAREQGEDNVVMTNWKVKYDGLNYKEFHLKTWWWDSEDGFVCDFSYNVENDIVASWSEVRGTDVEADIVTDLKNQFTALKAEAQNLNEQYVVEVEM